MTMGRLATGRNVSMRPVAGPVGVPAQVAQPVSTSTVSPMTTADFEELKNRDVKRAVGLCVESLSQMKDVDKAKYRRCSSCVMSASTASDLAGCVACEMGSLADLR
jgi:hypothetical protein